MISIKSQDLAVVTVAQRSRYASNKGRNVTADIWGGANNWCRSQKRSRVSQRCWVSQRSSVRQWRRICRSVETWFSFGLGLSADGSHAGKQNYELEHTWGGLCVVSLAWRKSKLMPMQRQMQAFIQNRMIVPGLRRRIKRRLSRCLKSGIAWRFSLEKDVPREI